jgi:hypothetical protein
MAFELNSVVPWGRTYDEYERMFTLTEIDLKKRIISFGDGPASFNAEMALKGKKIISLDPIYQFTKEQLSKRIEVTSVEVIAQMKANKADYVWTDIKSIDELKERRVNAMNTFLADFENGLADKRYIPHSLPDVAKFKDNEFELGLCSHFLLLYSNLGLDFHKAAITEMLRICKEVRIFPILTLNAQIPDFFNELLLFLNQTYYAEVRKVQYEFQKGSNKMLIIRNDN